MPSIKSLLGRPIERVTAGELAKVIRGVTHNSRPLKAALAKDGIRDGQVSRKFLMSNGSVFDALGNVKTQEIPSDIKGMNLGELLEILKKALS